MDCPFVSIIVPAYNAEKTINFCINSLLQQTYPKNKYEIIIVDNNSTDNTTKIIREYDVKYLKENRMQTSYAARNRGLEIAKGEIIAFTDSDCIADKNWLKNGVASFGDQTIGGIGGKVLAYRPKNYMEQFQAEKDVFGQEQMLSEKMLAEKKARIMTCNAFYRKHVFENIGFFNSNFISGGDRDLCLRVQLNTPYSLEYNENAVVYHKHRTTVKNFWKQYYKYGLGRIPLAKKYKSKDYKKIIQNGYFKLLYWQVRSIIPYLFAFLQNGILFMFTFKEHGKNKMKNSFLELLLRIAYLSGQISSTIKNRAAYFENIF